MTTAPVSAARVAEMIDAIPEEGNAAGKVFLRRLLAKHGVEAVTNFTHRCEQYDYDDMEGHVLRPMKLSELTRDEYSLLKTLPAPRPTRRQFLGDAGALAFSAFMIADGANRWLNPAPTESGGAPQSSTQNLTPPPSRTLDAADSALEMLGGTCVLNEALKVPHKENLAHASKVVVQLAYAMRSEALTETKR